MRGELKKLNSAAKSARSKAKEETFGTHGLNYKQIREYAKSEGILKEAKSKARSKALESRKEVRKVPVKTDSSTRMGFYHTADEKSGVKGHIKGETQYHHERAGKGYWSKDK